MLKKYYNLENMYLCWGFRLKWRMWMEVIINKSSWQRYLQK